MAKSSFTDVKVVLCQPVRGGRLIRVCASGPDEGPKRACDLVTAMIAASQKNDRQA